MCRSDDPPRRARYASSISRMIEPFFNSFVLFVDLSYDYTLTTNECASGVPGGTSETWSGVFAAGGPLICGTFGLSGALIDNPSGPDSVDMACATGTRPDAGVTVSGMLTLPGGL